MLILNQDKTIIVNLNNTSHIYIDANGTNIMCCCEILIKLGTYSSIERCKEILQDILTEYQSSEENKPMIQIHSFRSIENKYKFTYTMPEK